MSWSFAGAGATKTSNIPPDKALTNEWLIATEVITLNSSAVDQSTSVIDFIPYGKDWIIDVDPSATLATNAPVDIDYCESRGGTYQELATTGATVLKAGTASRNTIDNSVKGQRPYYKLRFDKAGALDALATKTVTVKIIIPPKDGVIY
jgi:hypothetical protein